MTTRLNIDDPTMWTPCSEPGCVWHVLTIDGVPRPCEAHWDGTHKDTCQAERLGWCVCGSPDSLLGSDPNQHPEITRAEVWALRRDAEDTNDLDMAACCAAALNGDGDAVDACVKMRPREETHETHRLRRRQLA
jgi:hypothetical protein